MRRSVPCPIIGRANSSKLRSIASRELSTAKNSTSEPSEPDDGLVTNCIVGVRGDADGGAAGTPRRAELMPRTARPSNTPRVIEPA